MCFSHDQSLYMYMFTKVWPCEFHELEVLPGSLSMEFSRPRNWSGLLFPNTEALPDPAIEPLSLHWRLISFILHHLKIKKFVYLLFISSSLPHYSPRQPPIYSVSVKFIEKNILHVSNNIHYVFLHLSEEWCPMFIHKQG